MSQNPEGPLPPLAIVGMGCLFPKAGDSKRFWANIKNGVDAITEVPASHWRAEDYYDADPKKPDLTYARRGGFLEPIDFDPAEFGITPSALEATDSAQLLGLVAAGMALRDAGYGPEKDFDRSRVSVILGVTGTLELVVPLGARLGHPIWRKALKDSGIEGELANEIVERIKDGYVPWQENSFPGLLGNVVAGRIANRYNLGGTNCVVDAACASSLSAAHLASLELATGRANMVVTGGADCFNDIFMYMCFSKTPALSPTGDSRPFDAQADGTILGEGLGMIVLKRLADAERDGDKIYAVLKGVGSSSDGRGKAIYAPSAEGQTKALKAAYQNAGVSPATVGLVEAHGTGTSVGDAAELSALSEVFREAKADGTWCALGSVKSMIGHTKAAAGSAGIIKAALALHHKVLPPTIKVRKPQPALEKGETPFYLSTEKRPWLASSHPRRAAVSALGFGGSNFHVVLEEYSPEKTRIDWDGSVQLAAFSGSDASALELALRDWSAPMPWEQIRVAAMRSRASFKAQDPVRLVLVIEKDKTDLSKLVAASIEALQSRGAQASWTLPEGAYFGRGAAGKLAFLFPGQGSQYVGMGRDAVCQFPQAFSAIAETPEFGELIYPQPTLDPARKQEQETRLRATENAQPALGAVSQAYLRTLEYFGLKPDAAAGHSYGELSALCAAGCFDFNTLLELSRARGQAMARGDAGRGAMLAVQAPLADIERIITEEKLDLVLANKNAPSQGVLSGRKEEIARACEIFGKLGVKCVALPVSAAFHSPLVAPAQDDLRQALGKALFEKPAFAVYANKTAKPYPEGAGSARELLASQLASPVEFAAMIERMHDDGARVFVEVGSGARLSGLVSSILSGKSFTAVAVDASNGRRGGCGDIARVLAQTAALGHVVELSKWEDGEAGVAEILSRPKAKLNVKLSGANHRSTPAKAPAPRAAKVNPDGGRDGALPRAASQPVTPALDVFTAFQRMQEQTAALHQKFLEGQELALRQFQALISGSPMLPQANALPDGSKHGSLPLAAMQPAPAPIAAPQLGLDRVAPAKPKAGIDTVAVLLSVVSEKTGYPAETLNVDMDLESDLGIDSIKRVEIMSAVTERIPGAPKVKPEHLGTLRTLKQIVAFLSAGVPAATEVIPNTPQRSNVNNSGSIEKELLAVVSEKTGYPAETLNPDMDLESDLGIDSIKRVEIMSAVTERIPGAPKVKPEHLGTLRTLKQIVAFLAAGAPAAAAPAPVAVSGSTIEKELLAVVSEKTGYPAETLNPDMDLESDLGIDSIKRVEIMSAVTERIPGAPKVKPEHLGTLRTLKQIVAFLSAGVPAAAAPAATAVSGSTIEKELLAVVSEKTGYPAETLNPDMDLESDLGIDSIKRVEIMSAVTERLPGAPKVKPEHLGTLRTLKQIVAFLSNGAATAEVPAVQPLSTPVPTVAKSVVSRLVPEVVAAPAWRQANLSLSGEVLVAGEGSPFEKELVAALRERGLKAREAGLDAEYQKGIDGLIIVAPKTSLKKAVWTEASESFSKDSLMLAQRFAEKISLFACVSRLDGTFGFSGGDFNPVYGSLAGLAKTAAREWPQARVKALDVAPSFEGAAAAQAAARELFGEGPVEIGLCAESRVTIEEKEAPAGSGALPVSEGDVVIVTGGARGVTAEAAAALATAKPHLVLWGRTAWPVKEPAELAACAGELELKKVLAGQKFSPKEIGKRCREILAAREISANIARLERLGARVTYQAVDVCDAAQVKKGLAQFKTVRGVIHGAGVLADKRIADKKAEQFEAVWSTKVASLRHLLENLEPSKLRFLVLFSSTTARLGRSGQSDYAMANEALNKAAQRLARRYPEVRVSAIGWGPWDGGMVDASLRPIFEKEGVALIAPEDGGRFLREEISFAGPAEIVALTKAAGAAPKASDDLSAVFSRTVTAASWPILQSHKLAGKPVVPLALLAEMLAHAALHGNPGLRFHGFDDLRVLRGAVLSSQSLEIALFAGKAQKRDGLWLVPAEARDGEGRKLAKASVVLSAAAVAAPAAGRAIEGASASVERAYVQTLFHGPKMRFIRSIDALSPEGVRTGIQGATAPAQWLESPWRDRWLADPAALDAAFQAMIVWTAEHLKAPSLPNFAATYRQYGEFPAGGCAVSCRVVKRLDNAVRADIEFLDGGRLIARIEGYECAADPALSKAFATGEVLVQ